MKKITKISTGRLLKVFYILLTLVVFSAAATAQNVGINATGNTPNAAAGLDVDFANKGLLIPRVALTSTSSFAPLSAHVAGMLIYNTATISDVTPGFYYNNGTKWISGFPGGIAAGNMLYWNGSAWLLIPPGSPGQYLQYTSSNIPTWAGATFATVTTAIASAITGILATSGGNISNDGGSAVLTRGICWNTAPAPTIANSKTIDGSGIGIFVSNMTGLTPVTTYYVRAYSTNSSATTYGNEISFTTLPVIPTLAATTAASAITGTTATSGGNVTSDGGAAIIERGVCYGTTSNPTIAGSKVVDLSPGTGIFASNITGLNGATLYYVRAYATNSVGTSYGTQISFTTAVIPPTLTTTDATSIAGASAVSGGSMVWNGPGYSNYQYFGVEYSINSDFSAPTTKVNTNSSNYPYATPVSPNPWVTNITGLTANTTYYIRSFLNIYRGGWSYAYGDVKQFTTTGATAPVMGNLTTPTVISANAANSGGTIVSDGGSAITAKGVCWSTSPTATLGATNFTADGAGTASFVSNISGLTGNTTYYLRAYATNGIGTTYSSTELSFTTWVQAPFALGQNLGYGYVAYVAPDGSGFIVSPDIPSTAGWGCNGVNVVGISNALGSGQANTNLILACSTGTTAASVANDYTGGGFTDWYLPSLGEWDKINTNYNLLGFGWSYNSYYTSSQYGTNYNYAATYFNTGSYAYSSGANRVPGLYDYVSNLRVIRNFGPATLPAVTTDPTTNITGTAATSGGNVTSDGGALISAGVCWSTNQNPTIADSKTVDASAIGPFVSNITGLTSGTLYYVRAYVTNILGTVYGNEVSFTPSGNSVPTLSTATVSNPTPTGATFGGDITSDGGDPVTERGVCWSDLNNLPTISDSKTVDGSGTGIFSSTITGLTTGFGYWICAYATNSLGTAYGQVEYYIPIGIPVIQTLPLSYTSPATTGTSGIYIIDYAGQTVDANGIVWGTSPNPTVSTNTGITIDPTNSNYITSTLTGLQQGITYYVRAYLSYGIETIYGSEFNFTPGTITLASVSTDQVVNNVGSFAEVSASLLTDGGDMGTISGICWSESVDPTVGTNLGITIDGYLGQYFSQISGLTVGTTYHVRAYATNSQGTSYGSDVSFTATAAYVGQVIQGGNIWGNVFSVDGTGAHGLIADPWGFGTSDWGCTSSLTGASGTAIGTGQSNTASIIADILTNSCISSSPAGAFAAEIGQWPGLDWYLPSKDEFDLLWTNRVASGLDASLSPAFPFWSSSEVDATTVWYFDGTTWQNTGLKTDLNTVWPIRSF